MKKDNKISLSGKIVRPVINFLDWIAKGNKNTPVCKT